MAYEENFQQPKLERAEVIKDVSSSKFTAKVFLYMFLALLLTGIISGVIGLIFRQAFPLGESGVIEDGAVNVDLAKPYLILLIVSAIAYIPVLIWVRIAALKGQGRIIPPFIIYAILMGVLLSAVTMFISWQVLGLSFAITSVAFLGMFLIGYFAKRDLSFLGIIAFGIMFGITFLVIFNLIWMLIFPATFQMMNWFISFGLFAFVILITILDMQRVKRAAMEAPNDNNLALLCAFNLYVDFIYIFIRVLAIVSKFMKR